MRQTVGSDTTNYLWDELSAYGDVVRETNGTGTELASYTLAGSQLLAQTRSSVTSYYLSDGQGSTRALLNGTGDITDTYAYTAFGEIYNQTGSTLNNYLYTGQQFDSLTGLYSLRARYYDPGAGRFVSRDTYPINYQNPIELNRYGYAAENPINLNDPTGLLAIMDYVQKIRDTAESVMLTLVRFGTKTKFLYGSLMVRLAEYRPWLERGFCFGTGFVLEGPDLPGCDFIPDIELHKSVNVDDAIITKDIKIAADGIDGGASAAAADVRSILETTYDLTTKQPVLEPGMGNIGGLRISIDDSLRNDWWAIGSDARWKKAEDVLEHDLGGQIAGRTSEIFQTSRPEHTEPRLASSGFEWIKSVTAGTTGRTIKAELFTEIHPCEVCGGVLTTTLDGTGGVIGQFAEMVHSLGHNIDLRVYWVRTLRGDRLPPQSTAR